MNEMAIGNIINDTPLTIPAPAPRPGGTGPQQCFSEEAGWIDDADLVDAECSIGKQNGAKIGYLDCQCHMHTQECDCDLADGEIIIECVSHEDM